jgi:hypothetical protein
MNPLRALDERVLPRLARGLVRIGNLMPGRPGGGSVLQVVAALSALGAVAVTFTALYLGNQPAPADETTGDVVRVGAAEGDQVPAYVERSRAKLAGLAAKRTGETYALVSFRSYVPPGAVPGLVNGVTPLRAYARVPLPNVQTEIVALPVHTVAVDVPAGMKRTADRKDALAAEADTAVRRLTGGGTRERGLRAIYEQDAKVNRAEAAAYRRLCACVYGAVVKATPARLQQLAKWPGIRVVDPAPEARRLDRTVFLPLQPEQTTVVSPPVDLPGATPTN